MMHRYIRLKQSITHILNSLLKPVDAVWPAHASQRVQTAMVLTESGKPNALQAVLSEDAEIHSLRNNARRTQQMVAQAMAVLLRPVYAENVV